MTDTEQRPPVVECSCQGRHQCSYHEGQTDYAGVLDYAARQAILEAFSSSVYIDAMHPVVVPTLLDAVERGGWRDELHEDIVRYAVGALVLARGWICTFAKERTR